MRTLRRSNSEEPEDSNKDALDENHEMWSTAGSWNQARAARRSSAGSRSKSSKRAAIYSAMIKTTGRSTLNDVDVYCETKERCAPARWKRRLDDETQQYMCSLLDLCSVLDLLLFPRLPFLEGSHTDLERPRFISSCSSSSSSKLLSWGAAARKDSYKR